MSSSAEEQKELGNKAFGEKKFDGAIGFYTKAIEEDGDNHVYYSNRSASHAGNQSWSLSKADADKCVSLSPSFIKGYYRLATAYLELNEIALASSTIQSGLEKDPDNTQLFKLLRTVRAKKKAMKQKQDREQEGSRWKEPSTPAPQLSGGAGVGDSSLSREIKELQTSLIANHREMSTLKAHLHKSTKEVQIADITKGELVQTSDEERMYRGVGKMFVLASKNEIMDHLDTTKETEEKKMKDMQSKIEYLDKKKISMQSNFNDLIKQNQLKQ